MGIQRFRFNSSRLTTSYYASPAKYDRSHLGTLLLYAEISFLVTFVTLAGHYVTQVYAFRRMASTHIALHREELSNPPQGCSVGLPVQAISSGTIPKSSFTVLEWSSTVSPPVPSFQQEDIQYFGPSALLDEDTAASCFVFAGNRGGAVLISNSEKYHITQFTLDNSVVSVSTSLDCYPKEGAIWGLFEGELPRGLRNATTSFVTDDAIYVLVGNFCFDREQGSVQTFAVEAEIATLPTMKFSGFYLEVLSNWGGSHSCICHLALHSNT